MYPEGTDNQSIEGRYIFFCTVSYVVYSLYCVGVYTLIYICVYTTFVYLLH